MDVLYAAVHGPGQFAIWARSGGGIIIPVAYLTRRSIQPEQMSQPDVDPDELHRALQFLAWLNRHFSGTRPILRLFARERTTWTGTDPIRVLDVGTGAGDIPAAMARWAAHHSVNMHITAVEAHPDIVEHARSRCAGVENIAIQPADARTLTDIFSHNSFDYVHTSLLLHELQDIEVLTVLRQMQHLSRREVIWNDLQRSRAAAFGLQLMRPLLPRLVKHDAPVSVAAGFSRREALDLAQRAGWRKPRWRSHLWYRFSVISRV